MEKLVIKAGISAGREERTIAELVQLANRFSSSIHLELENKMINAKSIMGMMTLSLVSGVEMTIHADGEDETAAIEALSAYILGK